MGWDGGRAMDPGRQFVIPEGSQRVILRTSLLGSQFKNKFGVYLNKIQCTIVNVQLEYYQMQTTHGITTIKIQNISWIQKVLSSLFKVNCCSFVLGNC